MGHNKINLLVTMVKQGFLAMTYLLILNFSFLIFNLLIFQSFNNVPSAHANVAGQTNVHDINIEYTGGSNNIIRYLPEEFRNDRYKTTGDLSLPGSSIQIMSPRNEKYINNIKRSIKILEYLQNTISFEKAVSTPDILDIELYDKNTEQNYIQMGNNEYGFNAVANKNPTLEDILSDDLYISPTIKTSIDDLTVEALEEALEDLKEHEPEGMVDNFLYGFSMFNLLIIEVMSLMFLIFGGLVWLTSGGEESQIERGRKTILWAVIGIVGGLLSYVLVNIIIQVLTT